ncbi:uncharacterized protein A4U43_C02F11380 [Asparagus officinalis]|uniref:Uncharacterized protein n=1 Tax=Asparagus officinalis TaxID=4686 RepID=A0A5P1FLL8_ASPOF|nr:uncharacterized protein A4U43_C02F11380 [Asparagus officinalis]
MQRSSIVTTKTNTKSTNETAEALSSAAEEEGSGRGRDSNSLTEEARRNAQNRASNLHGQATYTGGSKNICQAMDQVRRKSKIFTKIWPSSRPNSTLTQQPPPLGVRRLRRERGRGRRLSPRTIALLRGRVQALLTLEDKVNEPMLMSASGVLASEASPFDVIYLGSK